MARDATETRAKLLDAALRLWAEKGVGAVSLGEIRVAAGQRNESALQYHFGSRKGLLAAVFERHVPSIRARRQELLEIALRSDELRPAAEALVLPVAELISGDWRSRAFARVAADLLGGTSRTELEWLIGDSAVQEATDLFLTRTEPLPEGVAAMRLQVAANLVLHAAADYARRLETRGKERAHDPELFVANLVDMWIASTTAPASEVTRAKLEERSRSGRRAASRTG